MAITPGTIRPVRTPVRWWAVPIGSTLAASLLTALPIVATSPVLPPFGFLMALCWRFLRPELWPAWVALPLGAFDDLVTGAPLGSGMALWTLAFLAVDLAEHRPMWRDHWLHWGLAALCIFAVGLGGWAIAGFVAGSGGALGPILPPLFLGALLFPAVAHVCAMLDRWRLRA